jgi:hypothetical protein
MATEKSQHYLFTYKAMPTLFYQQNAEFVFYLGRDGKKFLEFWWDKEGIKFDPAERRSATGLGYEIHDFKERKLCIIKLPEPRENLECYFLGMLSKPKKPSIFAWKNLARIIALQRRTKPDGEVTATLIDITPRGRLVDVGAECQPEMKFFRDKLLKILQ